MDDVETRHSTGYAFHIQWAQMDAQKDFLLKFKQIVLLIWNTLGVSQGSIPKIDESKIQPIYATSLSDGASVASVH